MGDRDAKLQQKYDVWFRGSRGKVVTNSQNYDQNLKIVASFDTVQSFWDVYSHLARPSDLNGHCDLHVFKSGIRPLWEDDANKDGGCVRVRVRKSVTSRLWEDLLLAFVGEQFGYSEDVCGIIISCRFHEDYICVWNRNGSDINAKNKIRETLKRVLHLPSNVPLEYKQHSEALKKINNRSTYKINKLNSNQM